MQLYLDDTLILITADHSATHGENYTHRSRFTPDRIPLLWISRREPPGLAANGQEMADYCAQIDLPVTLLNLSGLPVPPTFMGNDLRLKRLPAPCWPRKPSACCRRKASSRLIARMLLRRWRGGSGCIIPAEPGQRARNGPPQAAAACRMPGLGNYFAVFCVSKRCGRL